MQINEHTPWGRTVYKGVVRPQRRGEHWAQGVALHEDAGKMPYCPRGPASLESFGEELIYGCCSQAVRSGSLSKP